MVACSRLIVGEMEHIWDLTAPIWIMQSIGKTRRALIRISSESIRNIWFKQLRALRKTWHQREMSIKTPDEKNNKDHLFSRPNFMTLEALEPSITSSLQKKQLQIMDQHSGQVCKAAERNSWRCLKAMLRIYRCSNILAKVLSHHCRLQSREKVKDKFKSLR